MNATQKLICILAAGTTLIAAAPAFADPGRGRNFDYKRDHRPYSNYDRHGYRNHERSYDRRHLVVVERPIIVERPVYYAEPAPVDNTLGVAAIIGAAIGGYIDNRQ